MAVLAGQRHTGTYIWGAIFIATTVLWAASLVSLNSERANQLAANDSTILNLETSQLLLGHTLLLSADQQAGLTNAAEVEQVVEQARQALGRLSASAKASEIDANAYTDGGFELLALIEDGDLDGARDAALKQASLHEGLASALTAKSNQLAGQLRSSSSVAGVAGSMSGIALGLAIPLLLVRFYRRQAQRQVAKSELATKQEAAAEVGRTKDEFIANLSHELRTPLTSIYGFAQVLEDGEVFDPESALELINLIIVESVDLARMVEDLLTAARGNAGVLSYETEPLPIEEISSDVMAAYERIRPIWREIEPGTVLADPVRLRQILRNLISNAVRHGGDEVRVTGRVDGDSYILTVEDTGDGVPAELVPLMFERFLHAGSKPLVAGSVGLGLHIAKALAEGMGSNLVYSHVDGRTTFEIVLQTVKVLEPVHA